MKSLRQLFFVMLIGLMAVLISCGGDTPKWEKTEDGLEYILYSNVEGTAAQVGDFLTLHMEQHTMNDSLLFSSFQRKKPLTFRFSKTLFKGTITSGLEMMSVGDSATFLIPVDKLYGDKLPRFAVAGDKLKYTVKLEKIQTQEEYRSELQARKKKESVQKENARIQQQNPNRVPPANKQAAPPTGHEGHDHDHGDHSGHNH